MDAKENNSLLLEEEKKVDAQEVKEENPYLSWLKKLGKKDVMIFYWEGTPGHVSLGTHQTYASFWPKNKVEKREAIRKVEGNLITSYEFDVIEEQSKKATDTAIIRNLQVDKIKEVFEEFKKSHYDWSLFSGCCPTLNRNDQNCSGLVGHLLIAGGIQKIIPEFKVRKGSYIRLLVTRAHFNMIALPLPALVLLFLGENIITHKQYTIIVFGVGIPIVLFTKILRRKNTIENTLNADFIGSIAAFFASINSMGMCYLFIDSKSSKKIEKNLLALTLIILAIIFLNFVIVGGLVGRLSDCITRCCFCGTDNLIRPGGIYRLAQKAEKLSLITPRVQQLSRIVLGTAYLNPIGFSAIFTLVGKYGIESLTGSAEKGNKIGAILGLVIGALFGKLLQSALQYSLSLYIHDECTMNTTETRSVRESNYLFFTNSTKNRFFSSQTVLLSILGVNAGILIAMFSLKNSQNSSLQTSISIVSGLLGFFIAQGISYMIDKVRNRSVGKREIFIDYSKVIAFCSFIFSIMLLPLITFIMGEMLVIHSKDWSAKKAGKMLISVGILYPVFNCVYSCCCVCGVNPDILLNINTVIVPSCSGMLLILPGIILMALTTPTVSKTIKNPSIFQEVVGILMSIVGCILFTISCCGLLFFLKEDIKAAKEDGYEYDVSSERTDWDYVSLPNPQPINTEAIRANEMLSSEGPNNLLVQVDTVDRESHLPDEDINESSNCCVIL